MLTDKEQQVLDAIDKYQRENKCSPTFEDVAALLGLKSKSTAHYHIKSLKEKGYVHIPEGRRKHIEIVKGVNDFNIPLVGTIAAGLPLDAYEVIESVDLSAMVSAKDRYLLKISGESMKDSGIMDGDLVLIQKQQLARDGQIVVALVDEKEATLKEFRMQNSTSVALIPHNDAMQPMVYPASRVTIQGVYLGLRLDRNYI